MSRPVSSIAIANEFITLGKAKNKQFTIMQVLKLVYIAHGWMLGFFDEPLTDDDIEAWKHGPVIPNLYHAIKDSKNKIVTQVIPTFTDEMTELDVNQKKIVQFVFQHYSHFTGFQLSDLTHQAGTPWREFFSEDTRNRRIPTATIARHYREKTKALIEQMDRKSEQE